MPDPQNPQNAQKPRKEHAARVGAKRHVTDANGHAWAEFEIEVVDPDTGEVHRYPHRHSLDHHAVTREQVQAIIDERKEFYRRRHDNQAAVGEWLDEIQ